MATILSIKSTFARSDIIKVSCCNTTTDENHDVSKDFHPKEVLVMGDKNPKNKAKKLKKEAKKKAEKKVNRNLSSIAHAQ